MITINPFFELLEFIPSIAMQAFVVAMIILVVVGTVVDMIHKKNVKYFFENAKRRRNKQLELLVQEKRYRL